MPVEIFFCYAHEDEPLRQGLEKQLRALKRQGLIDVWHDRKIGVGTDWEEEIDKHLNKAQVILLLISPDFMDSDYCYGIEMMRAIERHERGEAHVIPIILRPVYWQGAPFGKLQALPTNAKPVTRWGNRDDAFLDIANGIRNAVQHLLEQPSNKAIQKPKEEEIMITIDRQKREKILTNPYDISRSATARMFYGRSTEMQFLSRQLCEGEYGNAVTIYGLHRSGKTTLCKNFFEKYIKPPFWYVLATFTNAPYTDEEALLMWLAQKIGREFHEQLQLPAPSWHDYEDSDPQERFRRLLQDCFVKAPNSRLILTLDDFGEVIEIYTSNKQIIPIRFFTFWKELISELPQLSLIFSLQIRYRSVLSSSNLSNVFSFATSLPLQFLNAEDAAHLLIDPLQDLQIYIDPKAALLAVKLTGGSPYYITLIGQQLIYYLNREIEKQVVNDEDLWLVVDQLIKYDFYQYFVFLKREIFNIEELRVLGAIIEITALTYKNEVQLNEIVKRLDLNTSDARRYLDRLCNGDILKKHDPSSNPTYSYTIELVRLWLVHNRWFFSP
jgi:AAA+ ATPase superfamily predicted ATPase